MILVTGASGFVGRAVCARLIALGPVRGALRRVRSEGLPTGVETVVGHLSIDQDWAAALHGVRAVVHCAARVHVMHERSHDTLTEFRRINVEGTLHLARQAAAAGVPRFVFLSSIKVNGEQTEPGKPFTADQPGAPADPYGVSKLEAEQGLLTLARQTGMEVVVIRPPLVYGPGVKANFLVMMRWLACGLPLPLGAVTGNRRSLVALDNLVDLIATCIAHPAAANQVFLVSDGEDLSTAGLLQRMGQALGRPARLLAISPALLQFGARLLRRPGVAQRLCTSLAVDIEKTRTMLSWSPPLSVDEGLRRVVVAWREEHDSSRG